MIIENNVVILDPKDDSKRSLSEITRYAVVNGINTIYFKPGVYGAETLEHDRT